MSVNERMIEREAIDYQSPILCSKIWISEMDRPVSMGRWHYHPEIEFLAIIEGQLEIETQDRHYTLRAGDVFVMGPDQLHRSSKRSPEPLRNLVFQLDFSSYFDAPSIGYLRHFSRSAFPLIDINYIWSQHEEARREVFELLGFIYKEMKQQDKGYELAVSAAVKRILFILVRHDSQNMLAVSDSAAIERLQPVLEHIDAHLSEPISLMDISKRFNFNYHYFMKLFKKTMGMSFTEYVQYKRIKKAERLMLSEQTTGTEVSEAVGFATPAQFYKLFKRLNGCSPKEFVKKMTREEHDGELT
ncbi:MAG: AraC family transcriptional regulator [Paenibacillus sp.]|jgi:AraC-like DNA-binding protein|nr:AraC family transcriptional regulator [Paenibacillus sp.]